MKNSSPYFQLVLLMLHAIRVQHYIEKVESHVSLLTCGGNYSK